jgi:hypothetical protein
MISALRRSGLAAYVSKVTAKEEFGVALPNSYTVKPGSIPAYFEAMLNAEAPERFSTRFLEGLDFKSNNDRTFIGILKELGFIDADGVPKDRYFEFLDRSQSQRVVAVGVREAFADLFTINKNAETLSSEEVRNKLRTLYKGTKKDNVIQRIASTFAALCEYADFRTPPKKDARDESALTREAEVKKKLPEATDAKSRTEDTREIPAANSLALDSLQYHINIVLPESRDQSVYDALFKSLREHLGIRR